MKYLLVVVALVCTSALAQEWQFDGQNPDPQQLKQWQQQAAAEGKDLMLVLGANWCGDSTALLQQFNQSEFSQKLQQNYQVQPVDVGYFERGYDIVKAYDEPMYYGTPTVMIIDAETGAIDNFGDWQHWTNASKHSTEEFTQYFIEQSYQSVDKSKLSQAQQQQLNDFSQRQAQRVKAGYEWVAPHLKAYKDSGAKQPPQAFIDKWMAVAKFRNQVHSDIVTAIEQGIANPNQPLPLPSYPQQRWESEQDPLVQIYRGPQSQWPAAMVDSNVTATPLAALPRQQEAHAKKS